MDVRRIEPIPEPPPRKLIEMILKEELEEKIIFLLFQGTSLRDIRDIARTNHVALPGEKTNELFMTFDGMKEDYKRIYDAR